LPSRTILKERESKPLIEEMRKISGFDHLSHKMRVELENVKNADIVIVDGRPLAFKRDGRIIPVLINTPVLENMPRIIVDMGAVPHVAGGADIMAPGIRKVQGDFGEDQLVVIADEKHGKFLAVGSSMLPSATLAATKKGKVVRNLHYVGDPVWEAVKSHGPPPPSKS
jgi:PUA domain protein